MFARLPSHIRVQVVSLLAKNDFRAAKRIYDVWVQQYTYNEEIL
jgi:hypothetical protein